ncbi:MAG: prenyltransferase/squalene oxidase repeat-containing protein [Caldilineaceae bacterium]
MSYIDAQFAELHSLVADLGKDGGLISPSIYDTAQVIRLHPPPEGTEPAITWLLDQQQADGGWGEPEAPYARDVPTLATVLALHTRSSCRKTSAAVDAGLIFLDRQAEQWAEMPMDALPIATEMILPYLIEEANRVGLTIDRKPYATLYHLRDRKCRFISAKPLQVGTPPTYSWEALGKQADSIRPDCSGGIGHSPAATAAWLRQAEHHPDLVDTCDTARNYLESAAAATGSGIPGVVPNVWPITGFELAYGLYALLITDLLQHPFLTNAVKVKTSELGTIMQNGNGVCFGKRFTPDVDDTSVALAVLQATKHPVDSAVMVQFENGGHFCTFQHELNPSIFANAHALYGLAYTGEQYPAAERFLLERQYADGRWLSDKWHSSWLYTTLEVMLTLGQLGYFSEVRRAVPAILAAQKADGGWGSGLQSNRIETSYTVTALSAVQKMGLLCEDEKAALQQGHQWLARMYHPNTAVDSRVWLGKELYTPYRVDRIYELSALVAEEREEGVAI